MTTRTPFFSRRHFLEVLGLAGGGVLLRESPLGAWALPTPSDPQFLIMAYFGGGWDQLLALDPRDQRQAAYKYTGGTRPTSGIYPAYAEFAVEDPSIKAVMDSSTGTMGLGSGVQRPGASQLTFGPAIPPSLLAHAADFSVVRGMSMDTLTHEVGRRFFLTGKFPRGLAASGSSLNTIVAGQSPSLAGSLDLPNLVVGVETYNEGYPAFASGVQARNNSDVLGVLLPQTQNPTYAATTQQAIESFERNSRTCEAVGYDVEGLVTAFRGSQDQARRMASGTKATAFDFSRTAPMATVEMLRHFGIRETASATGPVFNATDLNGPLGRAALTAQALTNGLTQVASLQLAGGLDDHNDIYANQGFEQRLGWDALGRLLAFLKTREVKPGVSYFQRTTLLVFSEFARTPLINARDGRDHHLANSCLVMGPGIKGNQVIGATSDNGMGAQKVNYATGAVDPSNAGRLVRPFDVHATLLKSMGLGFTHLSNQGAQVVNALLR